LNSAVASLFIDKRSFDLSDCGTHLLEHLFGMIRRFCAGDDSQDKFDQSINKAIFVRKCISDLHLSGYIPGRIPQDSAAKVEAVDDFDSDNCLPFGSYVIWAIKLFYKFFGKDLLMISKINSILNLAKEKQFPPINFSLPLPTDSSTHYTSLHQIAIVNYNGNRNDIRLSTMVQDTRYMRSLNMVEQILIGEEVIEEEEEEVSELGEGDIPNPFPYLNELNNMINQ